MWLSFWVATKSTRLHRWLRGGGAAMFVSAFSLSMAGLTHASRPYDRPPLISEAERLLGGAAVLSLAFFWLAGALIFAAGHWPPADRVGEVLEASSAVSVAGLAFFAFADHRFILGALVAGLLLMLIGGAVRTPWIGILAPAVLVLATWVLGSWNVLATDMRNGMAEEIQSSASVTVVFVVFFVVLPSCVMTLAGVLLGTLGEGILSARRKTNARS
jgi:hypothetical protein